MAANPDNVTPMDGRAARSQRTRKAIADALFDLLHEGSVQPTIEEVAVRAGVAPRTVFQHYPDREALFQAVSDRQIELVSPILQQLPGEASLEDRLDALVDQRARVYEAIAPVRRAALLMEPFSELTQERIAGFRDLKRRQVGKLFRDEIAARPEDERLLLRAALAASASWSAWDALRTQQELDVETAAAAMRRTLHALLTAT
jgi:AcrR family transcriptional regulator